MRSALTLERILRALDPNDDHTAEPVSPLALVTLFVLVTWSVVLFLRWKVQPMQDVGHHLALSAVFADYGKEGSIYPEIYKPLDWLNTNSLLYTVAGGAGKVVHASWGFRCTLALFYLAGVPLANYYALRVFGRSAWGAVVSVPLTYNVSYVYGFANFLFAAPFAVVSLAVFYRMLVRPTKWRVLAVAGVTTCLFLAHLHVFLWTGVLLALMTVAGVLVSTHRTVLGLPAPRPWILALAALVSVVPSLALLGRWVFRATQPPPPDEYVIATVSDSGWPSFRAGIKLPSRSFIDIQAYLELTRTEDDLWFFVGLCIVGLVCVALARMHKWKRPPVLELACALTLGSYFLLPENFASQQVIASRQIGFGLWFASAFFTPVPLRVSWLARAFAIVGVTWLATFHLAYWGRLLAKFQKEEAAGFDEVLAAAPPRLRMHYVNVAPESKWFILNTFWHVEKWYMIDKKGQCNENPAYGVTQAIRYKKTYMPVRIENHTHAWSGMTEIWENFDLVLVHKWQPSPEDLHNANLFGERVAKHGDWDLWRSKVVKR